MYPAGLLGAGQATARCITRYLSRMASIRSRAFSVSRPSSSICWTGGLSAAADPGLADLGSVPCKQLIL